jgi:anaerobic selenocysteine-containing dehydrogenase
MTPTAAMADIVLPVASYLETEGIAISGLGTGTTYIQAQNKVAQIGECLSNQEIVIRLADKLGLGNYFWKDLRSYLNEYLSPTGIKFDEFQRISGVVSSTTRYRKYLTKGFNTPSGKAELYSSLCEKWGYDPLPVYYEPDETPVSSPEMVAEYPLILTSAHEDEYRHSQDRYIDVLRRRKPGPQVIINPATASELGIAEGDMVFIENRRGRIKQEATLNDTIDPRVISTTHGWWFPEREGQPLCGWDEANINILTDDAPPYSPEIGSPKMKGFLCKVYKA